MLHDKSQAGAAPTGNDAALLASNIAACNRGSALETARVVRHSQVRSFSERQLNTL